MTLAEFNAKYNLKLTDANSICAKDNGTALHMITFNDEDDSDEMVDAIKTLLAIGAKVDLQDYYGYTPLHFAVMHDNKKQVETLLTAESAAAALVMKTEQAGQTPLEMAEDLGRGEIAAMLSNA